MLGLPEIPQHEFNQSQEIILQYFAWNVVSKTIYSETGKLMRGLIKEFFRL